MRLVLYSRMIFRKMIKKNKIDILLNNIFIRGMFDKCLRFKFYEHR